MPVYNLHWHSEAIFGGFYTLGAHAKTVTNILTLGGQNPTNML